MELLIWLMVAAVLVAALTTGVSAWRRSSHAEHLEPQGRNPVQDGVRNGLIGLVAFTIVASLVAWVAVPLL